MHRPIATTPPAVSVANVRSCACLCAATLLITAAFAQAMAAETVNHCEHPKTAIGLSRVVEIDTRSGPLYGRVSRFEHQKGFLAPGEIVLTFDDGPTPRVTADILATLKRHCTRATFFPLGQRAMAFPDLVARVAADGHSIGAHSHSHPNMTRIAPAKARDEIERGFAAIALAARAPVAPFFRFPGLNENAARLEDAGARQLAIFNVDVVSDDSFAKSTTELIETTLKRARANRGGILLFHDLKRLTARALPRLLAELKGAGFKVVHMVSKAPFQPDPAFQSVLGPAIERAAKRRGDERTARTRVNALPAGLAYTQVAPIQNGYLRSDDAISPPKPVAKPAARGPIGAWKTTIGPSR